MKYFAWDDAKNAKLRKERRIVFEDVVFHIERSIEEEERATRAAEIAREERRQTAQHCRAVGDDLIFPTPHEFEDCR